MKTISQVNVKDNLVNLNIFVLSSKIRIGFLLARPPGRWMGQARPGLKRTEAPAQRTTNGR
jgi:hypothetical protein